MEIRLVGILLLFLIATPGHAADVGEVPPDYLGRSSDGEEIRLSEGAGRIRIVTFWATWCSPCLKELPVLNAIQKRGGADRIEVIAINLKEPKKQFRKALRAYEDFEITFIHDRRGSVARNYGVNGIPHMVMVDVDGRVAYKHIGYNESALEGIVAEINALLLKNNLVGGDVE